MSLSRVVAGAGWCAFFHGDQSHFRAKRRTTKQNPPAHLPGTHQSEDHSMSVLSLKPMDHALCLSAPLRPPVHHNRWDFNVLESNLQRVMPLIFHSQPQNGVGCRVGRGTCTSKDGHLGSSIERAAASTELHNVYSMALSVCGCGNSWASHRIGAAVVCPACSGTVFAYLRRLSSLLFLLPLFS